MSTHWISVADMVPPKEQKVLVTHVVNDECLKVSVGVAHIISYDSTTKKSIWTGPGRVTHWMPLPPAAL